MTDSRTQFARTAADLVESDPSVALVYAEISGRYFGDVERRHPDRVINVGIREQLLVNVGAGLALTGMRPIVHTFSSFLVERAFEQVKLGFGHQDVGGVLVGAGGSFDIPGGGRTHQSPGDVALLDESHGLVGSPARTYGHVIVDECHHISAFTFEQVMRQVKAKYVVGLTATPNKQTFGFFNQNLVMEYGHAQAVAGLASSTLYHYRVKSRDAAGNLARALYERYPDSSEGGMAKIRSHVVSRASCAVVARELNLGRRLTERASGIAEDELVRLSRNRNVLAALLDTSADEPLDVTIGDMIAASFIDFGHAAW